MARWARGPDAATQDPPTGQHQRTRRRLQERNIREEDRPSQATAVWASIDEQVGILAVLFHNMVMSPSTGQPWNGRSMTDAAAPAFAGGLAMAQQEAGVLSLPEDENYLLHANQANQHGDLAGAIIDDTEKIVSDMVEYPPGSRGSGWEAIAKHQADRELAGDRERDGDSRHRSRAIQRYWVILAAVVLAALDVALLWRPILNLGEVNSAGALYKWILALAFAGAQALSIDLVIHAYRERERDNRELRDAIKDHHRGARRGLLRNDLVAVAQPPPPLADVTMVDEQLRTAYRYLLATAIGVGIIGVFRVAFLSRSSGQSIIEATVFGAFVGMVLAALVLLLGRFACRGNRLGDRLRDGSAVIAEIESRVQEGARLAGEARDAARLELSDADDARAQAEDTRQWVLGQYWQAMLLAAGWLGLAQPLLDQAALVVPRTLAIAETAAEQVKVVTSKLKVIDEWLTGNGLAAPAEPATTPGAALAPAALPAGPTGRTVEAPRPGERGGLVPVGQTVKPPPTEPWWLLAAAAAAAVAIAFVAALIAPTPEGDTLAAPPPTSRETAVVALGGLNTSAFNVNNAEPG